LREEVGDEASCLDFFTFPSDPFSSSDLFFFPSLDAALPPPLLVFAYAHKCIRTILSIDQSEH
jgi:hypothetical protein